MTRTNQSARKRKNRRPFFDRTSAKKGSPQNPTILKEDTTIFEEEDIIDGQKVKIVVLDGDDNKRRLRFFVPQEVDGKIEWISDFAETVLTFKSQNDSPLFSEEEENSLRDQPSNRAPNTRGSHKKRIIDHEEKDIGSDEKEERDDYSAHKGSEREDAQSPNQQTMIPIVASTDDSSHNIQDWRPHIQPGVNATKRGIDDQRAVVAEENIEKKRQLQYNEIPLVYQKMMVFLAFAELALPESDVHILNLGHGGGAIVSYLIDSMKYKDCKHYTIQSVEKSQVVIDVSKTYFCTRNDLDKANLELIQGDAVDVVNSLVAKEESMQYNCILLDISDVSTYSQLIMNPSSSDHVNMASPPLKCTNDDFIGNLAKLTHKNKGLIIINVLGGSAESQQSLSHSVSKHFPYTYWFKNYHCDNKFLVGSHNSSYSKNIGSLIKSVKKEFLGSVNRSAMYRIYDYVYNCIEVQKKRKKMKEGHIREDVLSDSETFLRDLSTELRKLKGEVYYGPTKINYSSPSLYPRSILQNNKGFAECAYATKFELANTKPGIYIF